MQTITRVEALERASAIDLNTITVTLDLSGATTKDILTFPSHTVLNFTTRSETTFIDLVAEEVASVTVNGEPALYQYNGSRVTLSGLPLHQELEVEITASCRYSTTGEGLHRYFDPEDARAYLYTHFEPTDARRVFACFDQPGMKAHWSFNVVAPAGWVVLSNTKEASRTALDNNLELVSFPPTHPLSAYITAVVAGPYAQFTDGAWTGGISADEQIEIELGLYCRQSLAQYFDTDDVFKQTRAGFDFFHSKYGFNYPWGKYDQIYVPEYNIGAMENPGCVTFNEQFISRDTPSPTLRQRRANVIFHEMCHMWFGDLVTPAWWDDLWLKESFADNQGSFGLSANTAYQGEWASFAAGRKEWAYLQDQLPTTHPIAADIPDVEAAKQNFDGITYAKGASVLKQLVAYVGEEVFFAGARKYFARHAFSSASLDDLLAALEEAAREQGSDRDLQAWQRAWIHTASPSRLRVQASPEGGVVTLSQSCTDAVTKASVLRPHAFKVGFYDAAGRLLAKPLVELVSESVSLAYPVDPASVAFILPNDDDLTYAVLDLDEDALEYALANLSALPSSLSRAVVWSALWAAVRNLKLSPQDYLTAVAKHLPAETEFAVVRNILDLALQSVRFYLPHAVRDSFGVTFADRLVQTVFETADKAVQQEWLLSVTTLLAHLGRLSDSQSELVLQLVAGSVPGVEVGPNLRWQAIIAACAHGLVDSAQLDEYLQSDASGEAKVLAQKALAAIPQRLSRLDAWDQVVSGSLPNAAVTALLDGLAISGSKPGVVGLAGEFFGTVFDYWNSHSIVMGTRFVEGGYPLSVDAANKDNTDALLYIAQNFLDSFVDAPPALRRLMVEKQFALDLAVRIQRKWLPA